MRGSKVAEVLRTRNEEVTQKVNFRDLQRTSLENPAEDPGNYLHWGKEPAERFRGNHV